MTGTEGDRGAQLTIQDLTRRTVLKAGGGAAALTLGARTVSGSTGSGTTEQFSPGTFVDPVFGLPSLGPNPCAGSGHDDHDANDDCLGAFPDLVRPAAKVAMHTDLPEAALAVVGAGGLSTETTAAVNEAVADGSLEGDDIPDGGPMVGGERIPAEAVAQSLVDTVGFHFDPAHGVAVYHEGHGRQNRVPDGVGPMASPLVPAGGYWLAQFETEGVYDFYCPAHQTLGMAGRFVVWDGSGDVPALDVENTGRPPQLENVMPAILGGLDPNLPSSADALASGPLAPQHIVDEGSVSWEAVVEAHRTA
jgi:plastocyanin